MGGQAPKVARKRETGVDTSRGFTRRCPASTGRMIEGTASTGSQPGRERRRSFRMF